LSCLGEMGMSANQVSSGQTNGPVRNILIGSIFLCLVLQLIMALRFVINQDEFYNLNMGYEFLRGEIGTPFQTLMFRMSGWLRFLPGNEIDQIVAGRLFNYAAAIATSFFIYKTCKRYFSTNASLFAVLAYFGFYYVFRHLTAFRADVLVTMCLMAILWLVSDPEQSWRKVGAAGLLIGIAFTLSIKSIFYMPIVALFLLGRWMTSNWSRQAFLQGLAMFLIAIGSFAILFILHSPKTSIAAENAAYLQSISKTSFTHSGLFNRQGVFGMSLLQNLVGWGVLLLGLLETTKEIKTNPNRPRMETIYILAFIIPLTPIIFYYHANPYFYPFMLAPAMIFIAAAADHFIKSQKSAIFIGLTCIFSLLPLTIFVRSSANHQDTQHIVINAVHEIFPNPVPIIDYCGMISSFDRVNEAGLFINPDIFGHSKYLNKNTPIMADIVKTHQPQIILANVTGLDLQNEFRHEFSYDLLEEDARVLKENYLKFWGPVYVPGKMFKGDSRFEILMGGTYTYYGSEAANIDGNEIKNGEVVHLSPGSHEISNLTSSASRLVWGDNLKKPDIPEPTRSLFNGF